MVGTMKGLVRLVRRADLILVVIGTAVALMMVLVLGILLSFRADLEKRSAEKDALALSVGALREQVKSLGATPVAPPATKTVQGIQGEQGVPGLPGFTGPIGLTGPRGLPGVNGLPGSDGLPGTDGTNGKDGKDGAAGEPGPAGEVGPKGDEGPRGPEGPQGPVGPQGEAGPVGPQGPAGPAPSSFVFTINGDTVTCVQDPGATTYTCTTVQGGGGS